MKIRRIACLSVVLHVAALCASQQGFICVPIADLVSSKIKECSGASTARDAYADLPLCGDKGLYACPRLHQGLLHELVTIVEQDEDELLIQIKNAFYQSGKSDKKNHGFWTHASHVLPMDHQKHAPYLPEPIDFNEPDKEYDNVITLIQPHHDRTTGQTLSVGTRFCHAQDRKKRSNYHHVYIFDPKTQTFVVTKLPMEKCLKTEELIDEHKQNLFLKLAQTWCATPGLIPYVWGGCSFTQPIESQEFVRQEDNDAYGNTISFFCLRNLTTPKNGFDCTGLVFRAAQAVGIPFYFKNSTTMAKNLRTITRMNDLQEGDIMWIPGHVLIVSDLKNNLLIEARGYDHGYGKLQQIPLAKQFNGMKTYKQLLRAYNKKRPLERLNAQGAVVSKIYDYKLLKLIP